ncbi:MAG: restriction endonuclease subunit S [Thiotrichales bacterium]
MKFKEHSFKDLLVNIVDNRGKTCPTSDSGLPLIATNCIKNDALFPVFEKVRYVDNDTYENWFRGHPESGDMIFVCKGSPGRVAWVPDPVNFCIAQDMVAIRADETKVYPKYLFALLRSNQTQQKILNMHVGTLIPHFKKGDFGNLYLDIPEDFEYQKQVGDTYFEFCKKIELNRQINQILEHIAQAIFKSWFVDFEPVKAKAQVRASVAEGRMPGSDQNLPPDFTKEDEERLVERAAMCAISGKTDTELDTWLQTCTPEQRQQLTITAALFPDELEDDAQGSASAAGGRTPGAASELGPLPKGWCVSNIGNEFDVTMGQSPPGDTYNEVGDGIAFFQGRRDFGWRYPDNRVYCTEPKRMANKGDTLLSVRAPVGDVNKATSDCCIGRGISALRHKIGCEAYTYYSIQRLEQYFSNFDSEGTVFGSINQKDLKALLIVKPENKILAVFSRVVGSLDEEIRIQTEEIITLSTLRDSLLPKLLSGEISLTEAQDKTEAVA